MNDQPAVPLTAILETVAQYYDERLRTFGTTPRGVDWNSGESQTLRFSRLLEVVEASAAVSVLDFGCGYGALLDHLHASGSPVTAYRGFDISDTMVAAATARHARHDHVNFTSDAASLTPMAYAVASGIFNVRLTHPEQVWRDYTLRTLDALNGLSLKGFAFNMLSTYCDQERRRGDLFYGDPREMFDFCKRRFSARVALLHDYPLYEFTIIVRK